MTDKNVNNFNVLKLSENEYTKFADLIYKASGINLGNNKQELLKTRFQRIMRRLSFTSYSEYYKYVVHDGSGAAFSEMIDAISTNHTYFFREKEHFELLRKKALKYIVQDKRVKQCSDIRIWCAASSSGEEPYTILITILETIEKAGWNLKMLATDISTKVLKKALEGVYAFNQLRDMPPDLIDKYFDSFDCNGQKSYQIKQEVKAMISFRHFNLMTEKFPFKGMFDFIFCRNVMIYFDLHTQKILIGKMLDFLEVGGFFFIGHSETLPNVFRDKLKVVGPAAFQKI